MTSYISLFDQATCEPLFVTVVHNDIDLSVLKEVKDSD